MLSASPDTERGSQLQRPSARASSRATRIDGERPLTAAALCFAGPVLTYDQVAHLIHRKLQYQDPHDRLRQMFRAFDGAGPFSRTSQTRVDEIVGKRRSRVADPSPTASSHAFFWRRSWLSNHGGLVGSRIDCRS